MVAPGLPSADRAMPAVPPATPPLRRRIIGRPPVLIPGAPDVVAPAVDDEEELIARSARERGAGRPNTKGLATASPFGRCGTAARFSYLPCGTGPSKAPAALASRSAASSALSDSATSPRSAEASEDWASETSSCVATPLA